VEVSGTRPTGDDDPYKLTRADSGDWLTGYFAKMMPDVDAWFAEHAAEPVVGRPVVVPMGEPFSFAMNTSKLSASIAVPNELLMDYGVIPDTRPPLPPPSWRTRLRWKIGDWRTRAARRAYKIIDGDWPDDEPEDW
jgi:hypothetical protein